MSEFDTAELLRLFKNSPSPQPIDEVGEDGKEWAFEVVGEEVDGNGEIIYEVNWDDWERDDGTTQTWHRNPLPTFIRPWQRVQVRRRKEICLDSLDIELDRLAGTDIHNLETSLRAQALEEKVNARARLNLTLEQDMDNLLAEKRDLEEVLHTEPTQSTTHGRNQRRLRQTAMRRCRSSLEPSQLVASTPNNSTPCTFRTIKPSSTTTLPPQAGTSKQGSEPAANQLPQPIKFTSPDVLPPDNIIGKRKRSETESELANLLREENRILLYTGKGKAAMHSLRPRLELSDKWTEIAQEAGAASISFVNDIDDEEIPLLDPDFQYIEEGYIYSEGVREPSLGFLIGCSCDQCSSASGCECQAESEVRSKKGKQVFAYSKSGLFSFNIPSQCGIEVIECNDLCKCGPNCINRVAQRPRDVPLQIFKTQWKGWGVRSSVEIPRGKVLGIYSGRLITREEALTKDAAFIFDLDGQEDLEDGQDSGGVEGKYSVDSSTCGNWTRFVNHSCGPNMLIYLVGFGTVVPGSRRPYIAFVAREWIKPGMELTVDYDPRGPPAESVPEGGWRMKRCFCISDKCRKWVRMV